VAQFTKIESVTDFEAREIQDDRFEGILIGWSPPEREGFKKGKPCFRMDSRRTYVFCIFMYTRRTEMKEGIHPKYFETTITCACGNVIHTRSTVKNIRVEICSACHPFFTGTQKLVDTAGRVERFKQRYTRTAGKTVRRKIKTDKRAGRKTKQKEKSR